MSKKELIKLVKSLTEEVRILKIKNEELNREIHPKYFGQGE